jgi:hypothetical protein
MTAAEVMVGAALGALAGCADAGLLRWLSKKWIASFGGERDNHWRRGCLFALLNMARWGLVLAPAAGFLIGRRLGTAVAYLLAAGSVAIAATLVMCRRSGSSD